MFSTEDTIVAIATPPGRGGIGVVRISGPDAARIASALGRRDAFEPRHATFVRIDIDHVVVTLFPAPHSYTGEDVVEISAHGSPVVLTGIVDGALRAGARLANPGEFTLRAYLNGKMDLVQAEAVRDLIEAVTPLQARVAFDQLEGTLTERIRGIDAQAMDLIARLEASLDFPEEGYHFITRDELARTLAAIGDALDTLIADAARGGLIREGVTAAIVGRPNAGKSSLFNRLSGAERAIVTDVPGTTRDLVTERIDIEGIPFTLVDTAGLRGTAGDAIEEEGISRARRAIETAEVLLVVLDRSAALSDEDARLLGDTAGRARVIVASKSDLPAAWNHAEHDAVAVSSITDEGLARVREALAHAVGADARRDRAPMANVRHTALLRDARTLVASAAAGEAAGLAEEFVLADLHGARLRFDEIVGTRTPDDVLAMIFERFCIGK